MTPLVRLFAAAVLAVATISTLRAHAEPPWRFPVDGLPQVLRGFDPPASPYSAGHRGVDLAAAATDPIRAATAGRVSFAGEVADQGVVVVVSTGGLRETYEPVDPVVTVGEVVLAGELLGRLEPVTGHCGRTCLHWGVLRGATYLDPLSFIDLPAPVLLPLGAPVSGSDAMTPRASTPAATGRPGPAKSFWLRLTGAPTRTSRPPPPWR